MQKRKETLLLQQACKFYYCNLNKRESNEKVKKEPSN